MTITAQFGELAIALQYARYEEGRPKNIKARGYITFTAQPANTQTVVLNGFTYTFTTSASPSANQIRIGTTLRETLEALADAVNGVNNPLVGPGTQASTVAWASAGENRIYFTAFNPIKTVGNALTLSTTVTGATVTAFGGGVTGGEPQRAYGRLAFTAQPAAADNVVVGTTTYEFVTGAPAAYASSTCQVRIGATLKQTVERLARAINNTGVPGTDYSTGTPANANAYSDVDIKDTVVTVYAKNPGAAGNAIVFTRSGTYAAISGAGTLIGGTDASTYNTSSITWHRMRATDISYGEMQMQDVLPMEVGGTMTPTGAYKQGVAVGGSATFMPRVERSIGVLLLAALGNANTTVSGGVATHVFRFGDNEMEIPWIAVRRMIPGRGNIFGHGLIGMDNKVVSVRTIIEATAPIRMETQLLGRFPILDPHPEVWSGNAFEDFASIPLACKGHFKLPTIPGIEGREHGVTSAIIELQNATTGPREEMVVGSYYLDDIVPRMRVMTVTVAYKWRDPRLYNLILSGKADGKLWDPKPFVTRTDTSAGEYAFEILAEAPYNIPGTSTPFSLLVRANHVAWQIPQPPMLRPGEVVMLQLVGTVLYDAGGYAEFVLTNGHTAGYTVPSEP